MFFPWFVHFSSRSSPCPCQFAPASFSRATYTPLDLDFCAPSLPGPHRSDFTCSACSLLDPRPSASPAGVSFCVIVAAVFLFVVSPLASFALLGVRRVALRVYPQFYVPSALLSLFLPTRALASCPVCYAASQRLRCCVPSSSLGLFHRNDLLAVEVRGCVLVLCRPLILVAVATFFA